MSENSSEFLKRTCLICGCHTNQTINIYEPRGGPNIVQLIQAKFKFQPLNEDKYLCFSCNNWLINWHSLQALNSNDAESPSGTFRSHLNSGNVMQDEKSSGSKKQKACRPIAVVRPRLVEAAALDDSKPLTAMETEHEELRKNRSKINFNKRNFRFQLGKRLRSQHKVMQLCSCGKWIVFRRSTKSMKHKLHLQPKCSKCRELLRLKTNFMRAIEQVEKESFITEPHLPSIVSEIKKPLHNKPPLQVERQHQCLRLSRPTVDGKVVSMLRRLGTTLSREDQTANVGNNGTCLPQIMSPIKKPTQQWLRPLDDDEILIDFDLSVSEVLPSMGYQLTHNNSSAAKTRLALQTSETAEVIDLCTEEEVEEKQLKGLQQLNSRIATPFTLPQGLSIMLK